MSEPAVSQLKLLLFPRTKGSDFHNGDEKKYTKRDTLLSSRQWIVTKTG